MKRKLKCYYNGKCWRLDANGFCGPGCDNWRLVNDKEPTKIKVTCAECAFRSVDTFASAKDWLAYKCINPKSENYMALLNVSQAGNAVHRIVVRGCEHGKRRDLY